MLYEVITLRRQVERLAIALGQALGAAHDAARVDGLVGRDQDHGGHAAAAAGIGDVPNADHVGQDAFSYNFV